MRVDVKRVLMARLLWGALAIFLASASWAQEPTINYSVEFLPEQEKALVRITMTGADWMQYARFKTKGYDIDNLQATGELEHGEDSFTWRPKSAKAELSYTVAFMRQRSSGSYDAYMTEDWALLRGERLIPPIAVKRPKGAITSVHMDITLPEGWRSIRTGWPEAGERRYHINNPEYIFPRPAGWMVAGKLASRREQLGDTEVIIASPLGEKFKPLEYLAFLAMVWPEVEKAFGTMPEKILITGADDPMWRGGLSAPNSYYIHRDRPLVSANGTSTPIHELVHVVTGISGKKTHNWITEGIAEYYSVELLHRAGAFSANRKAKIFAGLDEWSEEVETLRHKNSTSHITGRAAVFFHRLDAELRELTDNEYSLDDLVRALMGKQLDTADLQKAYNELTGKDSALLTSELLKKPDSD
ncbi:MAG TPA: hypothetical protein VIC08_10105 [Cellvibrionaceae bacterium]